MSTQILRPAGRSWLFGDGITTDELYPGFAMKLPIKEAATHMFHSSRPDWHDQVEPGDILVAGRNFGMGSSRAVPLLFHELGVRCLLADYFNSLFLRNCINYGLPALAIPGISAATREGDRIAVDVEQATVHNERTGQTFRGTPYPPFVLELITGGGVIGMLERDGYLPVSTSAQS